MDDASERLSRTIWVGVGLTVVLLCVAIVMSRVKDRNAAADSLPVIGTVADFALTDQHGKTVTLADLRGRVWVADIIFTRCAGPCPRMTGQMESLQNALPKNSRARLVSLTTDPDFDTPEVLNKYASRFNADPERWSFLTGDKKQIAALAIDSLKLTAIEKDEADRENPQDLFIHSTIFVVVDKQARLRGLFETTGDDIDWPAIPSAILAAV
ncbi:MAG TPA: SCO family protein, partial [Verrucomicrobiota bacterium]|nr:SCO family protein [Verrucomicrobiota bacterium]